MTVKRITSCKDSKGVLRVSDPKEGGENTSHTTTKASAHQVDSTHPIPALRMAGVCIQLRICVLHSDKLDTASVPTQAMRKWQRKRKGEGGWDYLPCVMTMGSTITVGLFAVCDNDREHHNLGGTIHHV